MKKSVKIFINGKEELLEENLTIYNFLIQKNLENLKVAVEMNGEIVPRGLFESRKIKDGDRLEIVTAVGGG